MTNISQAKAPTVFYVILGISILSLVVMLAVAYSFSVTLLNPNKEAASIIDLAQLAAGILLNIAFIILLLKRSKAALVVAIIDFLIVLCGAVSPWIFQGSEFRNVSILIGQAGATVFWLLVVLKIREFCRNGLLQ